MQSYEIFDSNGQRVEREPYTVPFDASMVEKGSYPHFMLKEIYESPQAVRNALNIDKEIIQRVVQEIDEHLGVYFIGMGTAMHAAIDATYLFDKVNRGERGQHFFQSIDSSELPCKYLDKNYLVVAITQSGETKETLEALRHAKRKGAKTVVIVNQPISSATDEEYSDYSIFTGSGPEIAVPATKSYIGQTTVTRMLNNAWRQILGYPLLSLEDLPQMLEDVLAQEDHIRSFVNSFCDQEHYFFIGNGINYATAKEAALKFKEVSYKFAEAMTGGFFKHGTMSLITDKSRVFAFVSPSNDGIRTHIKEIEARKGKIAKIGFDDKCMLRAGRSNVDDLLSPLPLSAVGHLIAYHYGINLRNNVDRPRSLAKAVTVK